MYIDFYRPQVMAIINVTPDSFYAGSRTPEPTALHCRVTEVLAASPSIIDIGGYSSRPGADEVSPAEEWRRVDSGISVVRALNPQIPISIDTFRAEVVEQAVAKYGEVVVNDISAGELDPAMFEVVARHNLYYIAMHMKGDPQTMQLQTHYERDITTEVVDYMRDRVQRMLHAGICKEHIILDPGFGFAKSLQQNYELLRGLHRLCELGYPVLAGISRKSMIYKLLGVTPTESLNGTTALHWECLRQGATILRVHDAAEAGEVIRLYEQFTQK